MHTPASKSKKEPIGELHRGIGQKLYAQRVLLGLTMGEVAKDAGIAESTYCCIENGTANARIKTLSKVCEALGIRFVISLKEKPK